MEFYEWFGDKSASQADSRPQADSADPGTSWKIGDRVLASWLDGYFYPGRVRQLKEQSCEIAYDDGDTAWVDKANVRRPDIEPGSKVFCRYKAGPMFMVCIVKQQIGEKIHVEYVSGEREWTTISMVRVRRPISDVGPPAEVHLGSAFPAGPDPAQLIIDGMRGSMRGVGAMTAAEPMMGLPRAPFFPDVGNTVADSNWRAGDRVLGRWLDFY